QPCAGSPRRLNAAVPADLERILNKALEKDLALRYQNAADIRTDLQRLKRDTESGRVAASLSAETRRNASALSSSSPANAAPALSKSWRNLFLAAAAFLLIAIVI